MKKLYRLQFKAKQHGEKVAITTAAEHEAEAMVNAYGELVRQTLYSGWTWTGEVEELEELDIVRVDNKEGGDTKS